MSERGVSDAAIDAALLSVALLGDWGLSVESGPTGRAARRKIIAQALEAARDQIIADENDRISLADVVEPWRKT